MRRLDISLAATCPIDQFLGETEAHVQVPVHSGMTAAELKEALRHELHHGNVMGNTDLAFLLSSDFVGAERERDADQATRKAHAAVNRLRLTTRGRRFPFSGLEDMDEDADTEMLAVFVFTRPSAPEEC